MVCLPLCKSSPRFHVKSSFKYYVLSSGIHFMHLLPDCNNAHASSAPKVKPQLELELFHPTKKKHFAIPWVWILTPPPQYQSAPKACSLESNFFQPDFFTGILTWEIYPRHYPIAIHITQVMNNPSYHPNITWLVTQPNHPNPLSSKAVRP